jgi:hypothetical protein
MPDASDERDPFMADRSIGLSVILPLAVYLSAACSPLTPPRPTQPPPSASAAIPPSPTPRLTATPTSTITITLTPTPAVPLPDYPNIIMPGADRLLEIFRTGERSGMRRGIFSKVGDSITANGIFLVPFGSGGYTLGEYGYLQAVIEFFSRDTAREGNSFVHDSLAARTSWRAEHVLDPSKARSPCDPGESPLACEFRIVRPAIAVIMLGTNDAMAETGDYRETMRKIIVFSLNRGIIPILTTIPVLTGKNVDPYNTAIRDLAVLWDIPLIDLSAALAYLPNHGLGPDGIHLSWVEPAVFEPRYLKHGMTARNLLTLQALDAVWRSYPPDDTV